MSNLFFRGENRTDWLVGLMLSASFDFDDEQTTKDVADLIGFVSYNKHTLTSLVPPVGVVVTTDYVFVLCGGTRGLIQWAGDILGSPAIPAPLSHGRVAAFFYTVALAQYLAVHSEVIASLAGRRMVICGFSLGAASGTILKDIFKLQDGIDSATVFGASPRVGLSDFASGYPTDNFNRFQVNVDPIPGLPPVFWSGTGQHGAWIPALPIVQYVHIQPGFTLSIPANVDSGDNIPSLGSIIWNFNYSLYSKYHDPAYYAVILRAGLPDRLKDGFDGYANASSIDSLASRVFNWITWPWAFPEGGLPMASSGLTQMSLLIRDKSLVKGYQEVYFYNVANPATVFNAWAAPSFQSNLALRAAFLSQSCEIYGIRCSAVAPSPKQSLLQKFTPTIPGAVGVDEEEIDNDLCFFYYNATRTAKRQAHYGGVPNTYIDGDQLSPTGLAAIPLIDAWFGRVRGISNLVIKQPTLNTTITPAGNPIQFFGITRAVTGELQLQFSGLFLIPPNSLGKISKIRGFPLLRGTWILEGSPGGIAAGTVNVRATEQFNPPVPTGGQLDVIDPTNSGGFNSAVVQTFNNAGIRKRGRPLFSPRGRRSALLHHR